MLCNIEAERARRQMTKESLAKQLGVTKRTLYNWIHERSEIPGSALVKLSSMWNCSVDYLLNIESQNKQITTKSKPA